MCQHILNTNHSYYNFRTRVQMFLKRCLLTSNNLFCNMMAVLPKMDQKIHNFLLMKKYHYLISL
jgi:hypothetical protein